jgi:hypothetical protein
MIEPVSDLQSVAAFMRKYRSDLADASVVGLSERHPKARVFTVDFRDFKIYRRFKNQAIPLLNEA